MDEQVAYFDNAATTFPKPEAVYNYADSFYRSSGGNIGRGGNALAVAAGEVAHQAKDNLRSLYACPAREIAFTASATDALNRILLGMDLNRGDHVYISPFEHNAVTRPLNHLAKTIGVVLHVLEFDPITLTPQMDAIEESFESNNPKLVVLTHASNVCGAVIPVLDICRLAKRFEATTVVDMSQTAGLLDLGLEGPEVDFAVFAGHKTLLGPFGVGGFFFKCGTRLNPVIFGGNGINSVQQELPEGVVQMVEVGSQNTYAIAGLKASTDWILGQGMDAIQARERQALDATIAVLEGCGLLTIVGNGMRCERIGVVSTQFDDYSPDETEMLLGRFGVAVRSGIQCAPYAHRFLNTLPSGTVRFSVSALTNDSDIAMLRNALNELRDAG
ncbi:MAG: aminotransferase class V-fold PLP-dependent enzyme [Eggerthellaceae bacterium]|nr:aminotransferase class V-fold PLP-dependent enzyme [Eggerthellaceae bacterium]